MRFQQPLFARLRGPDVVHGQVGRDAADPGTERPREVEPVQGLVRAQEGLLHHVIRDVVAAHDADGGGVHASLVARHDLFEGKQVPRAGPCQHQRLGRDHRRRAVRRHGAETTVCS